jgi:hypothetical protein
MLECLVPLIEKQMLFVTICYEATLVPLLVTPRSDSDYCRRYASKAASCNHEVPVAVRGWS